MPAYNETTRCSVNMCMLGRSCHNVTGSSPNRQQTPHQHRIPGYGGRKFHFHLQRTRQTAFVSHSFRWCKPGPSFWPKRADLFPLLLMQPSKEQRTPILNNAQLLSTSRAHSQSCPMVNPEIVRAFHLVAAHDPGIN